MVVTHCNICKTITEILPEVYFFLLPVYKRILVRHLHFVKKALNELLEHVINVLISVHNMSSGLSVFYMFVFYTFFVFICILIHVFI